MDDHSFEAFVTECLPALSRYAFKLTRDRDASEDLVQDTLVRLAGAWRRIRVDGNPIAYAQSAMVRVHISRWRRRDHRPKTAPYDDAALDKTSKTSEYAKVDTRESLRRALRELPRLQQAVLVLTYVDDLPDDRIADLINRRPATVRSLRSRGLAAVRTRLSNADLMEATHGQA